MAKMRSIQPISELEVVEYVIYTRKSTEDDEKQKESISQQLENCFDFAKKTGLVLKLRPKHFPPEDQTIKEIEAAFNSNPKKGAEIREKYIKYYVITERKSAKTPYKREKWTYLMDEVKKGKIRGLFGYAPDRFSRNLQEGGELIQLVDKKILELKFTNFVFEDNASGHMMLGIFFVFAEHYSKKLSEDSTRGVKQKTVEGRTCGTPKTGYKRSDDEADFFVPDEPHFSILRQAFNWKIHDNWSDEKIAKEMNKLGWREDDLMTLTQVRQIFCTH